MVMRVPEYNQQLRYESPQVPAARLQGMQVQTNAAMFGGESGRQLEKAGYLVQRGADQLSHLVDDYNTTKARDAASKMQQGFLEWQSEAQKKQGESGINTAADYDTWAKTKREELTKGLSDVQRGRFEMLAGTQMASQRHWASGYGQQQEQTYKKATWQAEISVAADTLATNIQNPELAGQAMEQIKDAAFTMGQNMGIGEKATQELMRTSLQKALVPAIHARIQSGETGLASALMQQYEGSLGGTALAQLGAELKREQRTQAREARAEAREARMLASVGLKQRMEDASASYMAGAAYDNPPSRDELISVYGETQGDIMHRELEARRELGEDVKDLRTMTPEEQQGLLEARKPQEGEGFADRAKNYKSLVSAVQHDAEVRAKDPIVYLASYDPAVSTARSAMLTSMTPESVDAYTKTLQASMEARGMAGTFKKDMPLLAEADAHKIAADIASAPDPEKRLVGLQQSFGKHWPALEKQLSSGEKLPPDTAIVAAGMSGRPARLLLEAGKNKDFTNSAKAALGPDYKTMQESLASEMQEAFETFRSSGAMGLEAQVRNSAEKLAAAYMWQDGMSARAAARKATQDVIGERYAFKGSYRVPRTVDADKVDLGAQAEVARIATNTSNISIPNFTGISKEAAASRYGSSLSRNAKWVTNEDESGLSLFVGGVPVRNADGSIVQRTWDQLINSAPEQREIPAAARMAMEWEVQ